MSIRSSLLVVTISVGCLVGATVGLVGILNLNRNIKREAQQRVNHDLKIAAAEYNRRLQILSENIEEEGQELFDYFSRPDVPEEAEGNIHTLLKNIRESLDLTVLNICSPEGKPLYGNYPDPHSNLPAEFDPVMRRALMGKTAYGTLLLSPERLRLEGGAALEKAATVYKKKPANEPAADSALFLWAAIPITDSAGRVIALLYGGNMLNYNFELVDHLQSLIFGSDTHGGKPIGTVTIFLNDTRVATNVRGPDNTRAVGTVVSREVAAKVLEQGERWNSRALVVDAWYISAYQPISEPEGKIIGMLYVGLLESPYLETGSQVIVRLLWPALILLIIAVAVSLLLIRRITLPLERLSEAASHIREANWEYTFESKSDFREITQLSSAFTDMQTAIASRDRRLQKNNRELEEKNNELNSTNRNYMEMLGFITHELKSPMASAQQLINLILDGYEGEYDARAEATLKRIRRALEQSQDMVKNYLDLSRVERGELTANKTRINLCSEVLEPVTEQTSQLFEWKKMKLQVHCQPNTELDADPELLRIALTNFLNNAAKYGREGGSVKLEALAENGMVTLSVWNEGDGFTEEEGKALFKKFSRLRNNASRGARGSGLGLFLCKQICELHGGSIGAASELGKWARFYMEIPV